MVRLSTAALTRAHRFLLEIHAAGSVEILKRIVPDGLLRLIPADRASFNEIDMGEGRKSIVPTPVPVWWPRFGAVYSKHLLDHPLWNRKVAPGLNCAISLSDARIARCWNRSALCNEYFIPLGMKHQMSALTYRRGARSIGIAVNRSHRDFSSQERALLNLLCPHVHQALQNATLLAEIQERIAISNPGASDGVIAVNIEHGKVRGLSANVGRILRKHFGTDSGGNGNVPENLHRWLCAQQLGMASATDAVNAPAGPLVIQSAGGSLTARVAQSQPGETIVILEHAEVGHEVESKAAELTPREREVLHWIREGKRNSEIGTILGLSVRTVGKHLEHVFRKLGVETRTAAVRTALELDRTEHA